MSRLVRDGSGGIFIGINHLNIKNMEKKKQEMDREELLQLLQQKEKELDAVESEMRLWYQSYQELKRKHDGLREILQAVTKLE